MVARLKDERGGQVDGVARAPVAGRGWRLRAGPACQSRGLNNRAWVLSPMLSIWA